MGDSVDVHVSELYWAAAQLRDAGQRLQDGLAGIDHETRQLLDSGWQGDAASGYGLAWDRWHNGACQVIGGLQAMAEALTVAGSAYTTIDDRSGDVLESALRTGG